MRRRKPQRFWPPSASCRSAALRGRPPCGRGFGFRRVWLLGGVEGGRVTSDDVAEDDGEFDEKEDEVRRVFVVELDDSEDVLEDEAEEAEEEEIGLPPEAAEREDVGAEAPDGLDDPRGEDGRAYQGMERMMRMVEISWAVRLSCLRWWRMKNKSLMPTTPKRVS